MTRRGLQEEKKSVKCESCHAISVFDPDRAAQRCDFCGSPAIVPVDNLQDAITPESLLPAVIPNTQVRDQLREWYRSRWLAPNKLKRAALTDTLHGIYLPYWTFDAHVDADWTAESGYYYYVTETYRDSNGKTQTRQVRKTRWEASAGSLSHFFDDDAVPGTVGVHTALLRKVEPFPTLTDLKPYDPAYVRGWTVERYQVDLRQAAETSQAADGRRDPTTLRPRSARRHPPQPRRSPRSIRAAPSNTSSSPSGSPPTPTAAKSFQVVVNGYTGKMAGEHPLSWVKITLAVLAVILVVLILVMLTQR